MKCQSYGFKKKKTMKKYSRMSSAAAVIGAKRANTAIRRIMAVFAQSTLVISTSIASNNRLSRRENLILILT